MAFSKVLQKVSPLEAELSGLVASLNESTRLIERYEQELAECDRAVSELKQDFAKRTAEAESLKAKLSQVETTLSSARNLLEKLSGEKARWVEQVSLTLC